MNRVPIVIEPAAKSDIRTARDYYSGKAENISERFRDELTQVFDLVAAQIRDRVTANRHSIMSAGL